MCLPSIASRTSRHLIHYEKPILDPGDHHESHGASIHSLGKGGGACHDLGVPSVPPGKVFSLGVSLQDRKLAMKDRTVHGGAECIRLFVCAEKHQHAI